MKKIKPSRPWDEVVIELLVDPEEARLYLETAIEEYLKDGNHAVFLTCLRHVVDAQMGMSELAKRTGKSRQHLYAALSEEGNPRLDTILAILNAVGVLGASLKKEAA
ncbi:MAG: putative addiction module antidote protein [Rhodothermaceae bacterium]|nr:putative addiction module antidote protein [Rhodothermaceae bacterium]